MSELTNLSDKEYQLISGLVYNKFGINLSEQKRSLIVGRLNKVLHQNGFETFEQYYHHLIQEPTGDALRTLVDRISTNHTFFYREPDHFDFLQQVALPQITDQIKKKNGRNLRIWCAGCSSGEEPYTISLLLHEYFGRELSSWDLGVLATDISSQALAKAEAGIYADENISKLPAAYRHTYFDHKEAGQWQVKNNVKGLVLFKRLNLIQENYPFKGKFQMIFCRNVMIYFDKPTREGLLHRFSRFLEDGSYLFIGHSESLGRMSNDFVYVKPALYQKRPVR